MPPENSRRSTAQLSSQDPPTLEWIEDSMGPSSLPSSRYHHSAANGGQESAGESITTRFNDHSTIDTARDGTHSPVVAVTTALERTEEAAVLEWILESNEWDREHVQFADADKGGSQQSESIDHDDQVAYVDCDGTAVVGEEEATVVAISEEAAHPSELEMGAVQAEFIGQDYYHSPPDAMLGQEYLHSRQHSMDLYEAHCNDNIDISQREIRSTSSEISNAAHSTTNATVIDSAPLEQGAVSEIPLWKSEEAEVLEHADSQSDNLERKRPASVRHATGLDHEVPIPDLQAVVIEMPGESYPLEYAEFAEIQVGSVTQLEAVEADQEAEVVGIQEFLHPSEFVGNGEAEAELIGTDFSYAVSITTNEMSNQSQDEFHEPTATSIVEQTSDEQGTLFPPATILAETVASPVSTYVGPSIEKPPQQVQSNDVSWQHRPPLDGNEQAWPLPMPPPGATETNDDSATDGLRPDWLQVQSPARFGSTTREVSTASTSTTSDRSANSSSRTIQNIQTISSSISRGTSNVMEALFGDTSQTCRRLRSQPNPSNGILPRTLLPWSVIFSPSTGMWVCTLQTNQKALDSNDVAEASKSLRAFSLPTEYAAVALARAWTPRMHPFDSCLSCHICDKKFAVFRRKWHCRNCGVVVDKDCCTLWPSTMLPATYNHKKENSVNVCLSCNWLSNEFRLALLEGSIDKAIALHATGNINLHTPFANVKGELFYPVHCAVIGGSFELLKWLVDEHSCPIKSVRVSGGNKRSNYTPIVTSKGRSLLGIALENQNIPIVRYLVVDKGVLLSSEKDITMDMLIRNLDAVLRLMPRTGSAVNDTTSGRMNSTEPDSPMSADAYGECFPGLNNTRSLSDEARDFGVVSSRQSDDYDLSSIGGDPYSKDDCIICFENKIDCVATPCGHQLCCLKCSKHISKCPACSSICTFLRVYKA